MVNLTLRQMDILNYVLQDTKQMKVKDFAKIYNVSTRTIYREIEAINNSISSFSVKIINTVDGLSFEGKKDEILNLKLSLPCFTSSLEAESKKKLIIAKLLQEKGPIKLQYFANKFHLSTATISNYLKDIKKWFSLKNIELISKPGVGVYIESDEKSIRHAIADILYKNCNIDQLINTMKKYDNNLGNNYNIKMDTSVLKLFNVIDYDTILIIERILEKIEKNINYEIEDRLYIELSIHLAIAIKRLQNNDKVSLDSSTLKNLKNTDEYKIAKLIAGYVEEEIDIDIPEEEIGYMTIQLQGVHVGSLSLNLNEKYLNTITEQVIKEASFVFNIDFESDNILKKDLTMHLLYSLYRLKSGYKIRNPLIDDIKKEYGDIFKKCNKSLEILRKLLDVKVSDDEVGYITMHFAASIERMKDKSEKLTVLNVLLVCSNGIGVSRMLSEKLRNVEQLNVVDTCSMFKIDEMLKKHKIDIIISTIPIERTDVKVILINPLFTEKDIEILEKNLNIKLSMKPLYKTSSPSKETFKELNTIINYGIQVNMIVKNTFLVDILTRDVNNLIQLLLNEIINNKLITRAESERIKKILKDRDKLSTIVLPTKGFAIYHCTSNHIKEPVVCVGKLKNPIELINLMDKKEKVHTTFLMIAPNKVKESVEIIGDISASIISEPDFITNLSNSKDITECRDLIKDALFKKLYSRIVKMIK
jgi:mannitol operon transcriptional antiterminator